MAELIVSTVAMKLVEYVGQSVVEQMGQLAVEKLAPYFGGRDKLKKLEKTMKFIQARLHDAERRGEGENGAVVKEWLLSLKAVLFHLEDLFEEVATADQENEQLQEGGGKLSRYLCLYCSRSSPLTINKLVADEAKAIMEDLESIKSDMTSLGFREYHGLEAPRRPLFNHAIDRETGSYVDVLEEKVIGRDEDKNKIVRMLLDSNVDHVGGNKNVSVIPIVGIGGLGKTTVTQLVFNDENVQQHFQLKAWACVSEISTFEEFAGKILKSLAGDDFAKLNSEQIQTRLREAVNNKKYFIILDDVWDEDRNRWLRLKGLLSGGQKGSRIIVTTRSRVVAGIMGTVGDPYELGGLSKDESWDLFRSLAFKEGQEERMPQLRSIGREIVDKCANVPLAIRTIAALLYCKDTEEEWRSIKDKDLLAIEQQGGDRVMSTLKLSYDHLEPHLKQCFAYCSLFPKDYIFRKEHLIYHWMAQGYIESSNGNQGSPEDVGLGYFMELLRRSFFQDVKRDELTKTIVSCKMHDLMNDLARKVGGDGCLLVVKDKLKIKDNAHVWHVSCKSLQEVPSWLFCHAKRIRSVSYFGTHYGMSNTRQQLNEIFSSLRYLRTLDLGLLLLESLPDSIGEMKHLRYLRIEVTKLTNFPQSITRLRNLQILELFSTILCPIKIELPTGFNELISLRNLVVNTELIKFKDMPLGFGQLTALQKLSLFTVGENNGLDALANMDDLAGKLKIHYQKHRVEALSEAKAANLKGKKLTGLILEWSDTYKEQTTQADEEEEDLVLRWLQPPPTIRWLKVQRWMGRRFPYWGMDKRPLCSLPCLVFIHILYCGRCKHLPPFSKLPHLRDLVLRHLVVEYIEIGSDHRSKEYFPSLERLHLEDMHELKGWSKEDNVDQEQKKYLQTQRYILPSLADLKIVRCKLLMSMPLVVPKLESLFVDEIHGKGLQNLLSEAEQSTKEITTTTTTTSPSSMALSILKKLSIESVEDLEHLSIDLASLKQLTIKLCRDLTTLTVERPSSLRQLQELHIIGLASLRTLPERIGNLSELQLLEVDDCDQLSAIPVLPASLRRFKICNCNELVDVSAALQHLSLLEELTFAYLQNLRAVPEWIGHLTQLRRLTIISCNKLTALPSSLGNLTQLRQLHILFCPELTTFPSSLRNLTALQLHIFGCPGHENV